MEKQIITFSANEQILKKTAGQELFADDVVGYIEAHFDLGDNWSGYDSIRAVWFTAFAQISTVLDQDGVCLVPPEVCNRKEAVNVNLVGSIVENDELTDRLTTYPIVAFIFDGNARVDGTETAPVTPSQFEQFVAIVEALVGSVKDIDHATLNADYTLTIYYSDGTSDTVGPIRGEQGPTGPTGNGIASIAKTGTSGTNPVVDTYTITYTNGQTTTFTVTNGVKGDTGNGIQSIYKTGTSGAVDTYTILYTDGNTTEFTVTNGEVTNAVLTAAIDQAKEDLVDQFAVKDTASGVIASFPDGADWPAKNVLADIEPIQSGSGTPSPDNIRPISGRTECVTKVCGKNVCDTSNYTSNKWNVFGIPNTLKPNTTYKFSINGSTSINYSLWLNNSQTTAQTGAMLASYTASGDSITFTTPSEMTEEWLLIGGQTPATKNIDIADLLPQIELGSTATDYEAFDGDTYTVSWQTEAGTVYGGTIDLTTGVLTVDASFISDFTDIFMGLGSTNVPGEYRLRLDGTGAKAVSSPSAVADDLLCNVLESKSANSTYTAHEGISIDDNGYIYIYKAGLNTVDAYKDWLNANNAHICYAIATPTTYQLTPTEVELLLGANNVWADTGDIEVTYVADTKLYIDKMTA